MGERQRHEKILRLIRDHQREHCATPEKARAWLVRIGIYTEDGQLTPEYGGPPRSTEAPRRA